MRDLTRAREDAISVERRAKQRTAAFLLRHGRRLSGQDHLGPGPLALAAATSHGAPGPTDRPPGIPGRGAGGQRPGAAPHRADPGAHPPMAPGALRRRLPGPARGLPHRGGHRGRGSGGPEPLSTTPRNSWPIWGWCPRSTPAAPRCAGAGSPKPATVMPAGSWWKRPGPTACEPGSPGPCSSARRACRRASGRLAWKAQLRLCARYRRFLARGKAKQTIVTAIARELAAFIWAIGQAVEPVTA